MAKSALYSVPPDFYERVFRGRFPAPRTPQTELVAQVKSFYQEVIITLRDSESFAADMSVLAAP